MNTNYYFNYSNTTLHLYIIKLLLRIIISLYIYILIRNKKNFYIISLKYCEFYAYVNDTLTDRRFGLVYVTNTMLKTKNMYENRRFLPDQPIRLAFLRRDFFPSPVNGISVSIEMDLDESVEKPFYDVRFFPRRCIFRPRSELRDRCFLLSFSFLYPKQSEVLSPLLDARRCSPKKRSRDSGLTIGITQRGHFFPSPSLLPPSVVIT